MPTTTRNSPIESLKLPTDYSLEVFERAFEFVKKVQEIDKDQNHRGIFNQYITAMELYQSGSLDKDDLKNRITDLFKNCDVLLDGFDQFLNDDSDSDSASPREDIVVNRRIVEYLKSLRKESEGLRLGFIKAFVRLKEHGDGQIVKKEVDRMLRNYPCLKHEFKMILLEHGLVVQEEQREEITRDREDELFAQDMYFHSIESALKFEAEEEAEEEDKKKPVPVGVYGAIKRFYEEHDRRLPREYKKYPKLAVRRILPALKSKHRELLKKRRNWLKEVQMVNDSLVVYKEKLDESLVLYKH